MKHDDSSSSSMFDMSSQTKKSTAIEPSADMDFIVELTKPPTGILAPTQDYQSRQASAETAQSSASPTVESFLPSPNRFLVLGGLGLLCTLAIGAMASTVLTHTTTVKAQAVVVPVGDVQPIQSGNGGVVDTIFVKEYDSLTAGQIIASFENPSVRAKVDRVKAQIAGTEEHIVQIEGQLSALERRRLAEVTWLEQLTPGGVGVGNNLPQFEYSKRLLLAHQGRLETELDEEFEQLVQAQQEVENLTVRSPEAGTIYNLELKKLGQTFRPDETVAQLTSNGERLEIRALVPDTEIRNIEVGHPTKLTLSKCPSFRFGSLPGQVSSVDLAQQKPITGLINSDSIGDDAHVVTVETNNVRTLRSGSNTCELLPGVKGELTIITKQEKFFNFFLRKLRLNPGI